MIIILTKPVTIAGILFNQGSQIKVIKEFGMGLILSGKARKAGELEVKVSPGTKEFMQPIAESNKKINFVKAKDLIKKIEESNDLSFIKEILRTDTRRTVQLAVADRLDELE